MMTYLVQILLFLVVIILSSCEKTKILEKVKETGVIQIPIGKEIKNSKNINWPMVNDSYAEEYIIEKPAVIDLMINDSKDFKIYSKITTIVQEEGIIKYIFLTPLEHAEEFPIAVQKLYELGHILNIEEDDEFFIELNQIKCSNPICDHFTKLSLGSELRNKLHLFVEIIPEVELKKWYLSVSISLLKKGNSL